MAPLQCYSVLTHGNYEEASMRPPHQPADEVMAMRSTITVIIIRVNDPLTLSRGAIANIGVSLHGGWDDTILHHPVLLG